MKFYSVQKDMDPTTIVQSILFKTWSDYQDFSEIKIMLSKNKNILFQYNANTEEIVVKENIYVGINYCNLHIPFLDSLLGSSLVFFQTMQNQNGYTDVVQMKFENNFSNNTLQLKAEGAIKMYRMLPINF